MTSSELLLLCTGAIGFGFLLLLRGGNWLIDGAVQLARRMGMSNLLIGATVVAMGTSAPELLVSLDAALQGYDDLAVANAVGSNIGNILFVLSFQLVMVGAITVTPAALRHDIAAVMVASITLAVAARFGILPRWAGIGMVLALAGYVSWQVRRQMRAEPADAEPTPVAAAPPIWQAGLRVLIGLAALVIGAKFLVQGAVTAAGALGVSEAVIGLTIVAMGTSLPELFAGLVALRKSHGDIAIGNIIGSCLFNLFGILGATAAVVPLTLSHAMEISILIMLATTALLSGLLMGLGRLPRSAGFAGLIIYAAYTGWLYLGNA